MKWNESVNYNGKQENVLQLIKELEIPSQTYYDKRNLGWTAQEAFDYCLQLKNKKTNGLTIAKLGRKNHISSKTIYRGLKHGKTLDTIISEQQEAKKLEEVFLEKLRKQGLPMEHENVHEFLVKQGLNSSSVYINMQKGMNLYDAIASSFGKQHVRNTKHIFLGIQLKSLCQKYGLSDRIVNELIQKGNNYFSAIERTVFNQCFSYNLTNRANYLWNIYQNYFLKGIDIPEECNINEDILNSFTKSYYRMEDMKTDFRYYEFLSGINIALLETLSIEERVSNVYREDLSFTSSELYYILDFEHGLMSDFMYLEEQNMWVYKGNQQILEKLKPSN